jgi:cytochrome d ubiquinol oxidase subunit II
VDAVGASGDRARWFSLPNLLWFAPVPSWSRCACTSCCVRCAASGEVAPFLLTLALVFLGYSGLGISLWPNVIPPNISIWDAAGRRRAWASRWSARC